jgi:hypothetical protein
MTASNPERRFDVGELLKLAEPPRRRALVPLIAAALAVHAAVGLLPRTASPASEAVEQPVEIEIQASEAARAPEPPPAPAEPDPPESAPRAAQALSQAPRSPAAASAGAVLTAAAASQSADPAEPFDFTSDPNHRFGVGVVAVGGRAPRGLAGARASGSGRQAQTERADSAPARSPGTGLTKLSDLSRVPRLPARDPCQGYFPGSATNDRATALVRVVVGKSGAVSSAAIVSESPRGQGFGAAARTCMLHQRFTPALDRAGQPAATAVAVNVHFDR